MKIKVTLTGTGVNLVRWVHLHSRFTAVVCHVGRTRQRCSYHAGVTVGGYSGRGAWRWRGMDWGSCSRRRRGWLRCGGDSGVRSRCGGLGGSWGRGDVGQISATGAAGVWHPPTSVATTDAVLFTGLTIDTNNTIFSGFLICLEEAKQWFCWRMDNDTHDIATQRLESELSLM